MSRIVAGKFSVPPTLPRLIARCAPLELRIKFPSETRPCGNLVCAPNGTECINGYIGLENSGQPTWEVNLRPPAVGYFYERSISTSMIAIVMLMLSSASFDGFIESEAWATAIGNSQTNDMLSAATTIDTKSATIPATVLLVLLPVVAYLFLLTACWAMLRLNRFLAGSASNAISATQLASRFTLTLLPIVIAYHLAHYATTLFSGVQRLMPFSSDPLGLGWNLFGNAGLVVEPNLIDLQVLWSFVVAAIVFGHLLSVYLAHVVTLDLCADKRHVVRGQLPLLALMIGYTMLSIWILVQPNYA